LLTPLLVIREHDGKADLELFGYPSTHIPNRVDGVGKGLHRAIKQISLNKSDWTWLAHAFQS